MDGTIPILTHFHLQTLSQSFGVGLKIEQLVFDLHMSRFSHRFFQVTENSARLLLIEDDLDTAGTIACVLKALGYQVKIARGAMEAIQLASSEPFDVVVSDLRPTEMCGHAMIRQVWKRFGLFAVALVAQDDEIAYPGENGDDFLELLAKPVDVFRLHAAIQRCIAGTRFPFDRN